MSTPLSRFAAFALAFPLLLTATSAASADDPGAGHSRSDSSATSNSEHAVDADHHATETIVEAPAPQFVDPDEGFYTIPDVEGVEYLIDDPWNDHEVIRPGPRRLGTPYTTLTARALPGYELADPASWSWAYPNSMAPDFSDPFGTADDTFYIPALYGGPYFEYRVNGIPTDEVWQQPATGTVTIEMAPLRTGYEIIGPTRWSWTFTDTKIASVRTPPTFDIARSSYTIPSATGLQFLVNGAPQAPGTYPANGPVTIVSSALPGYFLVEEHWYHDFTPDFVDVHVGMEHYEHMAWMADTGISLGWRTPQGLEYRPLAPVGRDAMAAFLYRMAGSPKVRLPAASPFTDIAPGDPHYKAVVWASQQGITRGWKMSDGTHQFRPTAPIARDAMAAFLYRFAGEPVFRPPTTSCFADISRDQQFATEMCWMKASGISTGWADHTYRASQSVTRDAMAAFLHRYDERF